MTEHDLAALLGGVPLFERLGTNATSTLARTGSNFVVAAGHEVCAEGDPGHDMFVVLQGTLCVVKGSGDERITVATLHRGDFFGELSMLDAQPRTATVVSDTEARLFAINREAFAELVVQAEDASFALALIGAMAERVRTTTERYVAEQLEQRLLAAEIEADRHRALTQLVAGVAHELNTPLGVANTAVGILANRVASDRFQETVGAEPTLATTLEDIEEASELAVRNLQRANRLIESFKKVSVNQASAQVDTVDLGATVADVLELFGINARRSKLIIEVIDNLDREDNNDRMWTGDPGHLTQVLTNLLANVERHAYPDDTGGPVRITLATDDGDRTIEVADEGRGMDAETSAQIFTPFFTTARSAGGSGLGLAIVAGLVRDALGGEITVSSEPGRGSTFRLTFPPEAPVS